MTTPTKMYLEIVKKIRAIIVADGLKAGDKIPSERELSDRLNVGRSSVREALRALELLGLIETRRGEGTFIKDFKEHHLVELLGTFILEQDKTKNDLLETKLEIEKSCIQLLMQKASVKDYEKLREMLSAPISRTEFFKGIVTIVDNSLMLRIWTLVNSYAQIISKDNMIESGVLEELLEAMREKQAEQVIKLYEKHFTEIVDKK
ncbi:MAG: GntR family transcriptional regulator [Bacillota bacterium]|uniref:FadR/GntR family transcriptional regulator n=1 Tax=Bacillus sp. RO2 TaxID=2723913 RepID=UPI00145CAD66|nr:GntR family transcriptional regulator [Bacillus sp. RO2]MEA3320889.1 GntR family transcriptional regulator [Bacillota bacterium]NMH71838.1 FadR family transcriptional regulator [Bacillus sp. RO2]